MEFYLTYSTFLHFIKSHLLTRNILLSISENLRILSLGRNNIKNLNGLVRAS